MLNTVLSLTPLKGLYTSVPAWQEIIQSVVFAVLAWVIAGALAGLHYWLIRRDIRHDAAAGTSVIRSFFLNITEAIGIASVVPIIGFMLSSLGLYEAADVVTLVAFAVPTFRWKFTNATVILETHPPFLAHAVDLCLLYLLVAFWHLLLVVLQRCISG